MNFNLPQALSILQVPTYFCQQCFLITDLIGSLWQEVERFGYTRFLFIQNWKVHQQQKFSTTIFSSGFPNLSSSCIYIFFYLFWSMLPELLRKISSQVSSKISYPFIFACPKHFSRCYQVNFAWIMQIGRKISASIELPLNFDCSGDLGYSIHFQIQLQRPHRGGIFCIT